MKPETCRKVCDRLSHYLDDRLTQNDRNLVDEHLQGCSSCSRELAAHRKLQELVGNSRSARVNVRREIGTPVTRRMAMAAGVLLLVVGAYSLGVSRSQSITPAPQAFPEEKATKVEPLKRFESIPRRTADFTDPNLGSAIRVADIQGGEDFLRGLFDRVGLEGEATSIEESYIETIDQDGVTRQFTIRIR